MKEIIANFQAVLLLVCCLSLAVIGLAALSPKIGKAFKKFMAQSAVFKIVAFGAILYGGAKGTYSVLFPRTDPDIAYLTDAGSYVTNDCVHLDFRRVLAPDSAPFLLDCRPNGSTNDAEWVTVFARPFGEFAVPIDIPWPTATNYQWMAYTTWTPGPAVQTNGVWHLMWQIDSKGDGHFIPIRTGVYRDAEKIAPPVSGASEDTSTVTLEDLAL